MSALEVTDVKRHYPGAATPAVAGASFTVESGRTLAIVGESGAGKSTLARIVSGLERPDEGQVLVDGKPHRLRAGRVSPVQVVFQNPYQALHPMLAIGTSIGEPLTTRRRGERRDRVAEAMASVGLDPQRARQRPSSFSGGQLQRAVLARALIAEPHVLVCDEPTSALDVSVQAQIVNLLLALQAERKFACVLVTHDLGVVRVLSDDILVLRGGVVLEQRDSAGFFAGPEHEYSRELLAAERGPDAVLAVE